MKGIDVIKTGLELGHQWFTALMADAQALPVATPTPNGGNRPLWVLGHLVHSEAGMVQGFILGKPNPLAKWDDLFGTGSEPVADASQYPPLAELLSEFDRARAENLKVLAGLTDADLDSPSKAPPELESMFGTIGQCFVALALHVTFHAGQVADARRAAGRKPVFA
jgi:hypothetical protein